MPTTSEDVPLNRDKADAERSSVDRAGSAATARPTHERGARSVSADAEDSGGPAAAPGGYVNPSAARTEGILHVLSGRTAPMTTDELAAGLADAGYTGDTYDNLTSVLHTMVRQGRVRKVDGGYLPS